MVSFSGVAVKKKRAQVTFTVTNGPIDLALAIEKKRKKKPNKPVFSQTLTGTNGAQTVTVDKKLKPGRYELTLLTVGQTIVATFRVR